MPRKRKIILLTYAITALAVVAFLVIQAFRVEESNSIVLLFFPAYGSGLFLLLAWLETIFFLVVFFRSFRELRGLLLPMLLASSLAPAYMTFLWIEQRPVVVPPPGQIPVPEAQYTRDRVAVKNEFTVHHLSKFQVENRIDTVYSVQTDTLIYSKDRTQFFALLAIDAGIKNQHQIMNSYIVGRNEPEGWSLQQPKGNICLTHFDSRRAMRKYLMAYFYERYSINDSDPDKPSIWTDAYIFPD